jgi:hypothetical protein
VKFQIIKTNTLKMKNYLVVASTLIFSSAAFAGTVSPLSYSYTAANSCDNRCYYDFSFTKLTDGVLGSGDAQYNSSEGWVGWNVGWSQAKPDVTIDFTFSNAISFTDISFGALTGGNSSGFSFSVMEDTGSGWGYVAGGSQVATSSHRYSLSNLNFVNSKVRLSVNSLDNWILLDEIGFGGSVYVAPPPIVLPDEDDEEEHHDGHNHGHHHGHGDDISAVPLPAAGWLFGSALLGFMGLSNRRRV